MQNPTPPSGETLTNERPVIPFCIKFAPTADTVSAREIDLVMSRLDEIITKMKQMQSD